MINWESGREEVQAVYATGYDMVETLLTQDPPRHKVYRSLVNKVFSSQRIEGMRDSITKITNELIDTWIQDGQVDILNRLCVPLPIYVIADQLGVSRTELPLLKKWSDAAASRVGQLADEDQQLEDAKNIVEFQHYFAEMLDTVRTDPRDDIISDIANAKIDEGRFLTKPEALGILQQILVAGNETSTNAIAGGILLLIQNPAEQKRLRKSSECISNAVEEILRMKSPLTGMWRRTTCDTQIGDVDIPKDSMVMVRYEAANRDQCVFKNPDEMDILRPNAKDHLTFGQGIHFCLGAQLARTELEIALSQMLARTESWVLSQNKNSLKHHPNVLLRGLKELHINFSAR
jgi:cytochrome P450